MQVASSQVYQVKRQAVKEAEQAILAVVAQKEKDATYRIMAAEARRIEEEK